MKFVLSSSHFIAAGILAAAFTLCACDSDTDSTQNPSSDSVSGEQEQTPQEGTQDGDKTGQDGDKTGQDGDKTGQDGDKTGQDGDKTGQDGDKTGQDGDKTGQDGDKTSQDGDKTGQDGDKTDEQDEQDEQPVDDEPDDKDPGTTTPGEDETDDDIDDTSVDDTKPGSFIVNPNQNIQTTQDGETGKFTVILSDAPTHDVTMAITSMKPDLGTVSPDQITFTSETWNTAQEVTITGTTTAQKQERIAYQIMVGPTVSEDPRYDELEAIPVIVTHKSNIQPVEENIPVQKIELSSPNTNLLYYGELTIKAKVVPENATNTSITWALSDKKAAEIKKQDDSSITLVGKSPKAGTITLTATNKASKVSQKLEITLKPYAPLGFSKDEITSKFKNFNMPSCFNKTTESSIGDLPKDGVDTATLKVLNHDIYTKYVQPHMYYDEKEKKYYGTRASVVAAARFLVLQFPYDIPYYRIGTGENTTTSHYTWAANGKERADKSSDVRIFGFNLSKKAYGDYKSEKEVKVMKGTSVVGAIPWGTLTTTPNSWRNETNGHQCKNKAFKEKSPNGLECSGFVSWAFRNGRFNLGDLTTHVYGKTGKCGENTRNTCSKYINGQNPNNYFDSVTSKLKVLNDKDDFIEVSKLPAKAPDNTDKYFKAGDVLWKACYTVNSADGYSGHIALILGTHKGASKTYVYVAEATGTAGNTLSSMTWETFRQSSKWAKKPEGCKHWESYIIKMDKVYNFNMKNIKSFKKDDKGNADLNTYKYTKDWR
ncbi:MAG: hypothetical protein IJM59_08135 [Proteobacteria bacterium]|nr:hypothetical protein [Pseudomonadota bacterium]